MYYAYVLQSEKNGRYYYGSTNNIDRRLNEHNTGVSKYTRLTRPFKLEYFEIFKTLREARRREKFFKSGKGRDYLKTKLASAVA